MAEEERPTSPTLKPRRALSTFTGKTTDTTSKKTRGLLGTSKDDGEGEPQPETQPLSKTVLQHWDYIHLHKSSVADAQRILDKSVKDFSVLIDDFRELSLFFSSYGKKLHSAEYLLLCKSSLLFLFVKL